MLCLYLRHVLIRPTVLDLCREPTPDVAARMVDPVSSLGAAAAASLDPAQLVRVPLVQTIHGNVAKQCVVKVAGEIPT